MGSPADALTRLVSAGAGAQAFFTTPQEHANNRRIYTPRGKVLGGSSALNFMVSQPSPRIPTSAGARSVADDGASQAWTRGFADEYVAWAALAGSKAWTFNSLLPFFKKVGPPSRAV